MRDRKASQTKLREKQRRQSLKRMTKSHLGRLAVYVHLRALQLNFLATSLALEVCQRKSIAIMLHDRRDGTHLRAVGVPAGLHNILWCTSGAIAQAQAPQLLLDACTR